MKRWEASDARAPAGARQRRFAAGLSGLAAGLGAALAAHVAEAADPPPGTTPPSGAEAPPSAVDAAEAAEAEPSAAEAEPLEVTVEGDRAPPGARSLGRREIREMPGVLGDPYRAIEVQPGVTPSASGIPYFFIRGAPPGNIGYFFDGVQVPLLFHAGAGPGVLPPGLVHRVEMLPGPYGAERGRIAGAIIDAESAPPSPTWRGEASLRLDASALVEGPIEEDTSLLLGGRYLVGAPLLRALVPSLEVEYGDYQARIVRAIGPDERVTALAFGAYDFLATLSDEAPEPGAPQAAPREVLLDADFHRLDLRYERRRRSGTRIKTALTLGLDRSRGVGLEVARDYKVGTRASVATPVAKRRVVLRAGADAALDVFDVVPREKECVGVCPPATPADAATDQLDESFPELFPSRVDLALGIFADATFVLDRRSTLTPGLRVDHFASRGDTALGVDPKLLGRFGVGKNIRLVPAVGVASQPPGFAPVPALRIAGLPGGLQRSVQSSFGAEGRAGFFEWTAGVFRHVTFGLTDPVGTRRGTRFDTARFLERSRGDAYGLELGARGALRRDIFFVASYTLSRATRTREGRTVPSAFDRTHVAHVALLFDLGRGWRAGLRHVFYTGFPADEAAAGRPPSEDPERTRPFYRVDARLSKRWRVGQRGYLGIVFDFQNATLTREVFDVECDDRGCRPRFIGPIAIPTLALEAGF